MASIEVSGGKDSRHFPFSGLGRVQIPLFGKPAQQGEDTLTGTSGPSAEGTSILVAPGAIILGISALGAPVVVNQGPSHSVGCVSALSKRSPTAPRGQKVV